MKTFFKPIAALVAAGLLLVGLASCTNLFGVYDNPLDSKYVAASASPSPSPSNSPNTGSVNFNLAATLNGTNWISFIISDSGNILYTGGGGGTGANSGSYLFSSNDNGSSWQKKGKPNIPNSGNQYYAFSSNFRDLIVSGSSLVALAEGDTCNIVKSGDGGMTWTNLVTYSGIYNNASHFLQFVDLGNGILLTTSNADGQRAQSYRSIDGGMTWSILQAGGTYQYISYSNVGAGKVNGSLRTKYTPTSSVLVHSDDSGSTWKSTLTYSASDSYSDNGPLETLYHTVLGKDGTILRSLGKKLYLSSDNGATWQNTPLLSTSNYIVKFADFGNGNILLVTFDSTNRTSPGQMYKSADFGATWQEVSQFNSAIRLGEVSTLIKNNGIAIIDSQTAYFGTSKKELYVTHDAGSTWSVVKTFPREIRKVLFFSASSSYLLLTLEDDPYGTNLAPIEIYKSSGY
jgi:photosystem II stability/assembly factor-like uncharacterized protein